MKKIERTTNLFDDTNIVVLKITHNHGSEGSGTAHILYFNKTDKTLDCSTIGIGKEPYVEPVTYDNTDGELTIEEAKVLLAQNQIQY